MTNIRFYLAMGLPTFAVLVAIVINVVQFSNLSTTLNARMTTLETRMSNLEARLDLLTSKVIEIDNQLTRLETLFEARFNR
jgi:uncharacterized protein YqgV (UPF0045/DUF77 family)